LIVGKLQLFLHRFGHEQECWVRGKAATTTEETSTAALGMSACGRQRQDAGDYDDHFSIAVKDSHTRMLLELVRNPRPHRKDKSQTFERMLCRPVTSAAKSNIFHKRCRTLVAGPA